MAPAPLILASLAVVSAGAFVPSAAAEPGDAVRPGGTTIEVAPVRTFAVRGWRWGGDWTAPVDTQHVSTTGR